MFANELSIAEQAAARCGYVRCPNVASRWYLPQPGQPCLAFPMELHIHPEHAEPFAACAYEYGKHDLMVLLRWPTMEEFANFLTRHGAKVQPGLPAFSNAHD